MAKQIDNLKSGSDQWKTILAVVVVIATLALYYVNPLNFNSLTKVLVTLALFIAQVEYLLNLAKVIPLYIS